jgi:hypothetical protein
METGSWTIRWDPNGKSPNTPNTPTPSFQVEPGERVERGVAGEWEGNNPGLYESVVLRTVSSTSRENRQKARRLDRTTHLDGLFSTTVPVRLYCI